jgi:hypothetical protein
MRLLFSRMVSRITRLLVAGNITRWYKTRKHLLLVSTVCDLVERCRELTNSVYENGGQASGTKITKTHFTSNFKMADRNIRAATY